MGNGIGSPAPPTRKRAETLHDFLQQAPRLPDHSIAQSRHQIRALIAEVARLDVCQQLMTPNQRLPQEICVRLQSGIDALAAGVPFARVVNHSSFYGLTFGLCPDCLEPRPESEVLIDATRALFPDHLRPLRILDLGCGSGVLAVTLLRLYPHASALAIDVAQNALRTTWRNAQRHGVANRLTCRHSYWLDGVSSAQLSQCNLLISNPPYVSRNAYLGLQDNVRNYDPRRALVAGADRLNDGAEAYRVLHNTIQLRRTRASPMPWQELIVLVEHGAAQQSCVSEILSQPPLEVFQHWNDHNDLPRVLAAKVQTTR